MSFFKDLACTVGRLQQDHIMSDIDSGILSAHHSIFMKNRTTRAQIDAVLFCAVEFVDTLNKIPMGRTVKIYDNNIDQDGEYIRITRTQEGFKLAE